MVVKLRLARLSKRHQPFYNIVVAKDRSARDSKPMEVLGTFNPVPQTPLASQFQPTQDKKFKDIQLDITRTKYWLGVGAQPSEGVQGILGMLGLWEAKPGTMAARGRVGGAARMGGEKEAQIEGWEREREREKEQEKDMERDAVV